MDDKIPEPLSRPVEPMTPTTPNIPPASVGTTGASTPLGKPASNIGHPGRGKRVFKTLIFLIVLGAAGYFGYMWYQGRTMSAELSQAQSDKAAAEQKATDAEAKVKELEAQATISPTPTPKPDAEAITTSAKAFAATLATYKADTAVFGVPKISTKDKNFASVTLSAKGETGGSSMILKKVDTTWVVILAGVQNTVSATDKTLYGIPTDMP